MGEQEFYIGQIFEKDYPSEAAAWCMTHNAYMEEIGELRYQILEVPEPEITVDDYDRVLENHLKEERIARGYTLREPDEWKDSSIPRWHQDALDWIAHRDEVMVYGLEVMNHFIETGEAPTLEEFKEALPKIEWSYKDPAEGNEP